MQEPESHRRGPGAISNPGRPGSLKREGQNAPLLSAACLLLGATSQDSTSNRYGEQTGTQSARRSPQQPGPPRVAESNRCGEQARTPRNRHMTISGKSTARKRNGQKTNNRYGEQAGKKKARRNLQQKPRPPQARARAPRSRHLMHEFTGIPGHPRPLRATIEHARAPQAKV